jgi:predicted small lipoprotein YifL
MICLPPAASNAAPDARASHAETAGDATARGAHSRRSRSGRRTLAAGTIVVLLAFVTVQAGGCGFKTPLQLPKKAAPAKPAS